MSSLTVDWTPLEQIMIDAHRDPSLLRLNQKELRKLYPHLVGQLHLQQPKNLEEFQQKASKFPCLIYVLYFPFIYTVKKINSAAKRTKQHCKLHDTT